MALIRKNEYKNEQSVANSVEATRAEALNYWSHLMNRAN